MARSDDVGRAWREFWVALLRDRSLQVVVVAVIVHLLFAVAHAMSGTPISEPLLFAVGVYDMIAIAVAIKEMASKLRNP